MHKKLEKPGAIIATHNRPDFIRNCVLQLQNQSVKPHFVVIHHNGNKESYDWAVADLKCDFPIIWIHTAEKLELAHNWYLPALSKVLHFDVDCVFWIDHDDIYKENHIEEGLKVLESNDIGIQKTADLLLVGKSMKLIENFEIPHAPGGMASTLCFNIDFARELEEKLEKEIKKSDALHYPDQLVASMMPDYSIGYYKVKTAIYVCHSNTVSSSHWLKEHLLD